eukprot:TRINITY_DN66558_c7_g2_i1.p1 TRINITY_DN66558_c7_g2~~TRINITY_DN66558_c7_g2_i1.p1  ORF type:complete len:619 (+),score=313.04 TRINITY_DN66558_c7_g2_i1:66-1922(+)
MGNAESSSSSSDAGGGRPGHVVRQSSLAVAREFLDQLIVDYFGDDDEDGGVSGGVAGQQKPRLEVGDEDEDEDGDDGDDDDLDEILEDIDIDREAGLIVDDEKEQGKATEVVVVTKPASDSVAVAAQATVVDSPSNSDSDNNNNNNNKNIIIINNNNNDEEKQRQKQKKMAAVRRKLHRIRTLTLSMERIESRYEIKHDVVLGSGAFGEVKLCVHKKTGKEFAVKMIKKNERLKRNLKQFEDEINVHANLKHRNIIRLVDVFQDDEFVMLVMELAYGGELFDRILQHPFREIDAIRLVRRLFKAVAYLHSRGVVHRDLKPENILFSDDSPRADIKLTDFGFATRLMVKDDKDADKAMGMTKEQLGTLGYAAPEVFTGKPYTEKCDVWSLGIIAYILLCGMPPFVDCDDFENARYTPFWVYVNQMKTVETTHDGDFSRLKLEFPHEIFKDVSALAMDFLRFVLEIDPIKRPSSAEALQHPWLARRLGKVGHRGSSNKLAMSAEASLQSMAKASSSAAHAAAAGGAGTAGQGKSASAAHDRGPPLHATMRHMRKYVTINMAHTINLSAVIHSQSNNNQQNVNKQQLLTQLSELGRRKKRTMSKQLRRIHQIQQQRQHRNK